MKERISGDRGLKNDRFGVGLGDTAGVGAWKKRSGRADGGRGKNGVGIQEINAPVMEKWDNESMGNGRDGNARGRGVPTYKWM
jgi:hypothetical protein